MKFPRIAKALDFGAAEFETQDGAIAFSVEQVTTLETKLTDHSAKKEEWKNERATLETNHAQALEAANAKVTEADQKVTEANAMVGKLTTDLEQANAKIKKLEEDPAEDTIVRQTGAEQATKDKVAFSYSEERFKKSNKIK